MRIACTTLMLIVMSYYPAFAEINLNGDPGFGIKPVNTEICTAAAHSLKMCKTNSVSSTKSQYSPIRIYGNAALGVTYEDSRFNPKSNFSVIFDFSILTDSGLIIGATRKVSSNDSFEN